MRKAQVQTGSGSQLLGNPNDTHSLLIPEFSLVESPLPNFAPKRIITMSATHSGEATDLWRLGTVLVL